ncbi:MAG: thioredoxin family protein [Salinisphaeraceae bacterium]|nr:thioredoxin family protein [Salinisphaeraceae bacterium]
MVAYDYGLRVQLVRIQDQYERLETLAMALTPSNMLPLGTEAPDFSLPDTISGEEISLADAKSDVATVIMFICNHCPYVLHVNEELVRLAEDYKARGVSFVGISSNDVENYPQDGPEEMRRHAAEVGYPFPYLYDETQTVAQAYDAACTPDFFVFDGDLRLAYRGRLDGSTPGNDVPLTGRDLRAALDAVIEGKPAPEDQQPSMGCNIKWRAA